MSSVILQWPDKILSPNARPHHMAKAAAKREARTGASVDAMACGCAWPDGVKIRASWTFYPPDRRRRDLGNVRASMKAALDGVFDTLGVDDSLIIIERLCWGEVVPGGSVMLQLHPA